MQLLLVRHPRPAVGLGICYGSTDVAVDDQEVARVHAALAQAVPAHASVFCSPLQRCAALANKLRTHGVTFDRRLAEMHFGNWEMRPWDGIPRAEVDAWADDLLHYRPGDGENVLDVARRIAAFRDDLMRAGHSEVVVICHAGSIRLLAALHEGRAIDDAALHAARTPHQIGYGELVVLKD
jgi:alpha-ribazole phosphatase